MTEPSPVKTCPHCGTDIAPGTPEGLCPRCVASLNLLNADSLLTGENTPDSYQPAPTPAEIAPHFPQLEIIEMLGRGGMGIVYRARQKALDRFVALKLMAPERVKDPEFARWFGQEAQALAKLNHPNIVTVHDFGQAGGYFYLLMEFVDGVNLRQAMRAGRFTPEQALAVVPPVCEALQYAHDHGIVHRDIKPENLLMDRNGRMKIADFGIARMFNANHSNPDPDSSPLAGTPEYMAPEQRSQPSTTDHRADIYSLGVVLYEMLTGELPPRKLEPLSRRLQIDVRLDEIVLRALERSPEMRYQTAAEFRTEVEGVVKPTAPLPVRVRKTHPRIAAILVVLSLLAPILMVRIYTEFFADPKRPFDLYVIQHPNTASLLIALEGLIIGALWQQLKRSRKTKAPTVARPIKSATLAVGAMVLPLLGFTQFQRLGLGPVYDTVQVDPIMGIDLRDNVLVLNIRARSELGAVNARAWLEGPTLSPQARERARLAYGQPGELVWPGKSGVVRFSPVLRTLGESSDEWKVAFALPNSLSAEALGLPPKFRRLLVHKGSVAEEILFQISTDNSGAIYKGYLGFAEPQISVHPDSSRQPLTQTLEAGGYWIYTLDDGELTHFILFGKAPLRGSGGKGSYTKFWTEEGDVTLDNRSTFNFRLEQPNPDSLEINGRENDLQAGRVFVLYDDGTIKQVALYPRRQSAATVEDLAQMIAATGVSLP